MLQKDIKHNISITEHNKKVLFSLYLLRKVKIKTGEMDRFLISNAKFHIDK